MNNPIPEMTLAFAKTLSCRYHQLNADYESLLINVGAYTFPADMNHNLFRCVSKKGQTIYLTGFSTTPDKEIIIHGVDYDGNHVHLSPMDYCEIEVYQRIIVHMLNDGYLKQNK